MPSRDTTPEAAAVQAALWDRMTGAERVVVALEMSDDLLAVSLAGLAHRRPDLSPAARMQELIRLMHGVDVTAATSRS